MRILIFWWRLFLYKEILTIIFISLFDSSSLCFYISDYISKSIQSYTNVDNNSVGKVNICMQIIGPSESMNLKLIIYLFKSTMKQYIILLLITLITCELPQQRPIIGIFTQSTDSDQPTAESIQQQLQASNHTYIAASYIKFIQMSGAQVIPIFGYSDKKYFDQLLPKINGVLFPGGDVDIDITNTWTQNADYVFKYAMNENKKGNVFPIWGTCLGMQLIAYLTSGYDSKAIAPVRGQLAVKNTIQITKQNTLFNDLSGQLRYRLQFGTGILYFNHHFAVTLDYFNNNHQLKNFWDIEATTTTPFSEEFLSAFKAKNYPFYGVQFHPEKNLYQWKVFADRSEYGAEIVQILSNKFIELARKSPNKFSTNSQFQQLSIYNYKTQPTNMSFVRIYVFNETTSISSGFKLTKN